MYLRVVTLPGECPADLVVLVTSLKSGGQYVIHCGLCYVIFICLCKAQVLLMNDSNMVCIFLNLLISKILFTMTITITILFIWKVN